MKELTEILKVYRNHCAGTWAIATVVQTKGSSYRRAGARMLIMPDGATVGSVSGGCLEKDVILKARNVIKTGQTIRLTYDTTSDDDILLGVGLGCQGVIEILVEAVNPPSEMPAWLGFIENIFTCHHTGVIATIIRVEGEVRAEIGRRLMLDQNECIQGSVETNEFTEKLLTDMSSALRNRRSSTIHYEVGQGGAEVFIEVVQSPTPLIIFGAGYDVVPFVRLAKEVGFHVTVVDTRPSHATLRRFPQADTAVAVEPEHLRARVPLDERTAVVVMSHNYLADQAWLKTLLPLRLRYLGLMGPRKRAEKILKELWAEGLATTAEQMEKLHNPVGLDIGAEGPEQIALAILAEIQAVIMGYAGGLLREKRQSIHSPQPMEVERTVETFADQQPPLCLASA